MSFFKAFGGKTEQTSRVQTNNASICKSEQELIEKYGGIPITFLSKYGTKTQMNMAFQHYIDRHQLEFVKPNFRKAVALLEEGKEVVNNGEKEYAEFAVKHGLNLVL